MAVTPMQMYAEPIGPPRRQLDDIIRECAAIAAAEAAPKPSNQSDGRPDREREH